LEKDKRKGTTSIKIIRIEEISKKLNFFSLDLTKTIFQINMERKQKKEIMGLGVVVHAYNYSTLKAGELWV
jgi:hypothetical protein